MTPEEVRMLQKAYEDACKSTEFAMQLHDKAKVAIAKSHELLGQTHEMTLKTVFGDK